MRFSRLTRWLLVAGVLLGPSVAEARADGIFWYTDLKQASAAAEKANLPMFIDFWAEWCAPCKAMDEHVYTSREVIEVFRRRVIAVRLHFDLHRELARTYNVAALPHLVFANSHGMPLVFHRGFLGSSDLARVVNAFPPIGEINRIDLRLRKDRNAFPDLVAMARALRTAGFFESSTAYYDRASRHPAARGNATVRQSIQYELALSLLELRDGARAAAILEKSLKERPDSVPEPDFLLALTRAYVMAGLPKKARPAVDVLLRSYPQSAAAAKARALIQNQ